MSSAHHGRLLENISMEGLQKIMSSQSFQRVKQSHVLKFLEIFKQEVVKLGATPIPNFYTKSQNLK